MSKGLIDFYKVYKKAKVDRLKMQLCLSVHDSAVVLAPEGEIPILLEMFKATMCKPRRIGDHEVSFLGDVKIMDDLKGKKQDEKPIDDWIAEYERRRREEMKGHIDGKAWLETGSPTY